MERLPLETQTLYAEFSERLLATQARRSLVQAPGCFTTKRVKGERYIYFQYSDPGGRLRQAYVGKQSPALDRVVADFQQGRPKREEDAATFQRLCAQLRAGGALTTDIASARILKALADCGLFHLGGVLVGTHAFTVLGNLLGVRWGQAFLRTQDIDIAGSARLDVGVPETDADIPKVLDSLRMGFVPVPAFNLKRPSTSFKVRGQPVRVDFLTPARRRHDESPVFISRFRVAAQPLPYLGYLLEQYQTAGVVDGGGILVNVPHPARYAFHKLLVARSREVTGQTKAEKDLEQARQMLMVLAEDRPGDLALAWEAMESHGTSWLRLAVASLHAIEKRHRGTEEALVEAVQALKSHLRPSRA